MAISYETFFPKLLDAYRVNYNIEEIPAGEHHLAATGHMHLEESQCVMFKEMPMWSADTDEYVYFFRVPHLTDEICEACIKYAYDDGFPKIRLDHVTFTKQHMCTRLAAIFLCDTADADAVKRVKKCRIYKNFMFSFKGWMEMHTCVTCFSSGTVDSNGYGRETAKYMKKLLTHLQNQ